MNSEYKLLKSVRLYIDQQGNLFNADENGNVNDAEVLPNIIRQPGVWWQSLSKGDYVVAELIWRSIWDK